MEQQQEFGPDQLKELIQEIIENPNDFVLKAKDWPQGFVLQINTILIATILHTLKIHGGALDNLVAKIKTDVDDGK